jgi:hypothetical protein
MTPLGTLVSDYLPILNEDYYTEITAVVTWILFHNHYHFESSEGHKFNIAKVSTDCFNGLAFEKIKS